MDVAVLVGHGLDGPGGRGPDGDDRWRCSIADSTSSAVVAGTTNRSGYGGSPDSCDDTPVCRVIGTNTTPAATSWATSSGVKPRAADGISALPGSRANTVW